MSVIKRNKENTEAALLAAAVQTFQEVGYAKARVSDIVGRCGLSQGTFYLYFKSKEDILRRVLRDFMEQMNQALDDVDNIFDGQTSREVRASLSAFLEKMLLVHQRNLGPAEILWREGFGHGGVFAELHAEIYAYFLEIVQARMAEAVGKGLIRDENIEDASVFLISLFERSSFYFMIVKGAPDIPRLAASMARFILHGLLPESKAQPGNHQGK